MFRQLRDMHEAFFAGQYLYERTEVHDALHHAGVDRSDLDVADEILDDLLGLLAALAIGRRDEDPAVVFDIDLHAGIGDDLIDDFAAWPDDVFDLLGIDLEHVHARCERGETAPRLSDRLAQLADDEDASVARLLHRAAHDIDRDALHLDVHLHGGDAVDGAGDFEVHLAERVLEPLDVRENTSASIFEDETHRDAAHVFRQRHTGIHERERARAHRAHRRRSV